MYLYSLQVKGDWKKPSEYVLNLVAFCEVSGKRERKREVKIGTCKSLQVTCHCYSLTWMALWWADMKIWLNGSTNQHISSLFWKPLQKQPLEHWRITLRQYGRLWEWKANESDWDRLQCIAVILAMLDLWIFWRSYLLGCWHTSSIAHAI
jgi:hypothetical protein